MSTYIYREDGYDETFEAADDKAAIAEGMEKLRGGEWGQESSTKTFRVRAGVYLQAVDEDGEPYEEIVESLLHEFEPAAPKCTEPEHDWREGQAYGSGGGVTWTNTCRHCGLKETHDTWDTDRYDGTVMATTEYTTP